MNRGDLARRLDDAFDATTGERRVVARAAGDLADAGRYAADAGVDLTADVVVVNLADAPENYPLVERWNWWMGALEMAYGGYDQFQVRRWREE
ncbi:hypothetical protein ACFQH6_02165 [Halobacteriaceae archaeon GCM10025711]